MTGLPALLIALGAFASEQSPLVLKPAGAQLVVVDVFVVDRKGRPVGTLRQEDFELREDRRPVPIAAFQGPSSVSADEGRGSNRDAVGSRAAKRDALTMVVLVDLRLLTTGGKRRGLAQAEDLAGRHIEDGGRVVVVTQDGTLRPVTPLTGDSAVIHEALEGIGKLGARSPSVVDEGNVLDQFEAIVQSEGCLTGLPQLINVVRDYARWRAIEAQEARDRLNDVVDALVGVPGRKALVYVSEGLEQRPGIHLFDQIGEICPEILKSDFSSVLSAMQEIETSPVFRDAAARANAARVTFYPIDARGLVGQTSMDLSRGNKRYIPSGKNDFVRDANLVNPYQTLAEETGGFALIRGLAPAVATRRLRAEAAGHYVLAFAPVRDPDGKAHDLTVRLKTSKEVEVRHRMSYLHAEPSIVRAQRALSALFFGLEENALGAELDISRSSEGTGEALVRLRLPVGGLSGASADARMRVVIALRSVEAGNRERGTLVREKEFVLGATSDGTPQREFTIGVPVTDSAYDFAVGIENLADGSTVYLKRTLPRR